MLMYLLCKGILAVLLVPVDWMVDPVNMLMGLSWVADNPDQFTQLAPHGGIVASASPVNILFSSMGIANTFLPVREWFLYILPVQVLVSGVMLVLAVVRIILRFVPTITAGQ